MKFMIHWSQWNFCDWECSRCCDESERFVIVCSLVYFSRRCTGCHWFPAIRLRRLGSRVSGLWTKNRSEQAREWPNHQLRPWTLLPCTRITLLCQLLWRVRERAKGLEGFKRNGIKSSSCIKLLISLTT